MQTTRPRPHSLDPVVLTLAAELPTETSLSFQAGTVKGRGTEDRPSCLNQRLKDTSSHQQGS